MTTEDICGLSYSNPRIRGCARAENELEGKLKAVRTDRGCAFNSWQFSAFCIGFGIKYYSNTPYTPQQNGVVQRRNETVVEICMMKSNSEPAQRTGKAVSTDFYVQESGRHHNI